MKNVEPVQKGKTGFGAHYADMIRGKKDDKKGKKKSFIENLKKRSK